MRLCSAFIAAVNNKKITDALFQFLNGFMYAYFQPISNVSIFVFHRWDKPDSHIVEAMESRMKDLDLASERSIKVISGFIFVVLFFFIYPLWLRRKTLECGGTLGSQAV